MRKEQFYHALKVNKDLCYGCTHCMNVCPTDAIRIVNGQAQIKDNRCVDCGECMRSCPVDAFFICQDDFQKIFQYQCRVAVLPSVFIGQFSKKNTIEEINAILQGLGFTHVVLAEAAIGAIVDTFLEAYEKNSLRPLISPFCPAIVRLIQVRFPSLVAHLIPVKSPNEVTARYYRSWLEKEGHDASEIGIFYVTPCAAKIASVVEPIGERGSSIDGVINMDVLYNLVSYALKNKTEGQHASKNTMNYLSSPSLQWSLTGGEAKHMQGRCLAIDEIHNVISFLEMVEDGELMNVDFLELRACDQSCAGGVLLKANRFLTTERLNRKAEDMDSQVPIPEGELAEMKKAIYTDKVEPRSIMVLDEDMATAMKKMERVRAMMCYLPGIDCSACGSSSCEGLAKDIVNKEAHLSNCVFLQRMMEKNKKLDPEHSIRIIEKTWGKDRLTKDCHKKGAKHSNN